MNKIILQIKAEIERVKHAIEIIGLGETENESTDIYFNVVFNYKEKNNEK